MKKFRIERRVHQKAYLPITKSIFCRQGELHVVTIRGKLFKEANLASFMAHLRKKLNKKGAVACGHPLNQTLTSKALGSRIGKGKGPVVGKGAFVSERTALFTVFCGSVKVATLKKLVKKESAKKLGAYVAAK